MLRYDCLPNCSAIQRLRCDCEATRSCLALLVLLAGLSVGLASACSSDSGVPGGPSGEDAVADKGEEPESDAVGQEVGGDSSEIPTCQAGETTCINSKKATCDPKFGWLLEPCPEGTSCADGGCQASLCEPLASRCLDGGVQICAPDGHGWSDVMPCPEDTVCKEGVCVDLECKAGEVLCADNKVLECAADGSGWVATPCGDGEVCLEGRCIECISDDDCDEGFACEEGSCIVPPLEIVTLSLPDGKVGEDYVFSIEAAGGVLPHAWSLVETPMPAGLTLGSDGKIDGTPEEAGDFAISVQVEDAAGATDQAEFDFSVFAAAGEVVITTGSPLPKGEEGTPYEVALAAAGGEPPYFWGISAGALPAGLTLTSSGVINGTPADHGDFTFTVKVFDNAAPTGSGAKEFVVTMTIAPLEIVGDQEFDLWITKIIVLPLVTAIEGIPFPYETQLKAKGGVKPYFWAEQPLPGFVSYLIPNGGIPDGLTLEEDGTLHGAVTDPSTAINVKIPFTQIDLTGYFFMAEVKDSQEQPDSATAIYLVPTVPITW